ncbi:hypothetical protein MLD38_014620 [Melastoma candidum]|uniref:Uncharacterized protein n=1 Tax=Melastoma candidum TaxID=119954 RepID=A0ACB9RDC7_9MYRT|nr:hypothetical protein MLD38_014620 [Melastoma candidum]
MWYYLFQNVVKAKGIRKKHKLTQGRQTISSPSLRVSEEDEQTGDWTCRSCHRMNFQWRGLLPECGPPSPFRTPGPDVRPGDWYCAIGNCGTHNFANRTTCFRCGSLREELINEGGLFENEVHRWRGTTGMGGGTSNNRPGWRAGDWICTRLGCNEHNFANRTECFRCNAPRDPIVGYMSYASPDFGRMHDG